MSKVDFAFNAPLNPLFVCFDQVDERLHVVAVDRARLFLPLGEAGSRFISVVPAIQNEIGKGFLLRVRLAHV